jgi:hypothetical protein
MVLLDLTAMPMGDALQLQYVFGPETSTPRHDRGFGAAFAGLIGRAPRASGGFGIGPLSDEDDDEDDPPSDDETADDENDADDDAAAATPALQGRSGLLEPTVKSSQFHFSASLRSLISVGSFLGSSRPGTEQTVSGSSVTDADVFGAEEWTAASDGVPSSPIAHDVGVDTSIDVIQGEDGKEIAYFAEDPAPLSWIDPLATIGYDFATHAEVAVQAPGVVDSATVSTIARESGSGPIRGDLHVPLSSELAIEHVDATALLDPDNPVLLAAALASTEPDFGDVSAGPAASSVAAPEPEALLLLAFGVALAARRFRSAGRREGRSRQLV